MVKKKILVDKANTVVSNLDFKDIEKIEAMVRIAKHCKDMAALI